MLPAVGSAGFAVGVGVTEARAIGDAVAVAVTVGVGVGVVVAHTQFVLVVQDGFLHAPT